jgi:iron complex outermembrane receptor protein
VQYAQNLVTGQVTASGSQTNPGGVILNPRFNLGSGPVQVTFNEDGTPRAFVQPTDLWNFAPVNYLQIPLTRTTAGALGHFRFNDHVEAYFEASYNLNKIERNLAPAPLRAVMTTNLANPLLTPETRALLAGAQVQPGISRFSFTRRMLELGNRVFDSEKEYQRVVGGLRGEILDGWDYDAWLIYTTADDEERILNNGSVSRLQQAMLVDPESGGCINASGGCVPADVFGAGRLSAGAVDFVRWHPLSNITERDQYVASVVVTGSPLDIWTGPLDMAFGVEWRRDELHFEADPILFSGDVIGLNGNAPIDGTESVLEFYSEALATLFESRSTVQKLDLEAGIRWSDYDLAGSVTTWKAGLDWRLTESLRFRTMYQHAVRAPNNSELFTQQSVSADFAIGQNESDPCSASANPVANGNADKCQAQGLTPAQIGVFEATAFYPTDFIAGGNPELVPESSDTFTLGMVLTPTAVPDLTIAIDYYDLEVTDTIGNLDPAQVCFDDKNTAGLFCDRIQRDSTGNIYRIENLFQNRGLLATDGIDFQAQYSLDLPDSLDLFSQGAQLYVDAIWTHVLSLQEQANVVTDIFECSGFFGRPCTSEINPENRLTMSIDYGSGPFTARFTWRWIDGAINAVPKLAGSFGVPAEPKLAIPEVGSINYFDLGLSYLFGRSLSLRFGINNLADEEPVFMADAAFANNTAASTYDVFGRSYYFGLSYQFGGH